uniref:Phospholipase A2-like central domain-containing protein n=1 Tax=Branchiostoma floridae TaxID=7739 RepID=C3YYK9_BRAFL|eukprot:XP_002598637.1 hypothetical protein BRAFLDRAFT_67034 [Branchiostoma floridae]
MLLSSGSVLLLLVLCGSTVGLNSESGDEPPHRPRAKRNLIQFANMIETVTGRSALHYNFYGCYCGWGGSGTPVDGIDRCCQVHDLCYDNNAPNAKWITYDYTAGRGWVTCAVPSIVSQSDETCLQYAKDGDCDFYKCLEDKYRCGAKGYPIGYGYRYCSRFRAYYDDFNDEGKAWIDNVRKCRMKALVPIYKSKSYSCDEVKTLAFRSHSTCYVESGFCKVFPTNKPNKRALMKVYQICDFFGPDSALLKEQILMTSLQCQCDYGLADERPQVVDATSDFWTDVLDFTAQRWRDDPKEAIQSECEAKALQGDCDFYNCLERRHPCGLKGFASREGRPFCEELKRKKGLFTAQGQAWVTDFTKCLTRSLLPKYREESISCRHINNYGYRVQDTCFIDAGVCELEEDNQNEFALWYTISNVVRDSRFQLELSTILCRCHKYEGGNRYRLKYSNEHGIRLKQKAPVVDQTSPADLPCTNQGGQCQDYAVRTCLAGYETNKCGGDALRRCCLQCDSSCQANHQTWSAGDNDCSNAGGQCKMDSNLCYGQYQTGLCGGPAGRKCCVLGSGASSSGSGWPSFSQMQSNYPLYRSISWDGLVDQEGLPAWLKGVADKNTCAMRVSRALTHAGTPRHHRVPNLWIHVRYRARGPVDRVELRRELPWVL